MNLDFLREHPETIDRLIAHQRIRTTSINAGPGGHAERWTLDDGTDLFAKSLPTAPADFFAVEARCLRWLAAADAIPIPEVIAVTLTTLVLEWVEPGTPSAAAAEQVGRDLAALHASGAGEYADQLGQGVFGAPWQGYLATAPQDNRPLDNWPEFYVERRCVPFLRTAVDAGTIDADARRAVEAALTQVPDQSGPAEPPARLHGDLWRGNLHFGADGDGWLVDPAAYLGHRETDLAELALFDAPQLDRIVAAYHETAPLADGWRKRVPLHQLHMLLAHCALFGTAYVGRLLDAVAAVTGTPAQRRRLTDS